MFRKIHIVLFAALVASGGVLRAQEVSPRIAGLEGNTQYMSLLREDAQLQFREDSVVRAVEGMRTLLREQPEQRQQIGERILGLESGIFNIRNARGRLIDRINAIEQEWVLSSLNSGKPAGGNTGMPGLAEVPDSLKVRNLVDNIYFRKELEAEDYAALRKAQIGERTAADYLARYLENYNDRAAVAVEYASVPTEADADTLYKKFTVLQGISRVLEDSLAATWNYIFDNKNYAYGYLLDKLGREDLLTEEETKLSDAMRRLSELQGQTASDAVADYRIRKEVLTNYEAAVAGALKLDAARDSLRQVVLRMGMEEVQLSKIEVKQRYFYDFAPVEFSSVTPYSYQNPIPECRIFERGTVYRVLLGTFATKRAASLFKGASPLCYQVNDEGKWLYFAGGFATREAAEAAQKQLKAKGFLRPEVVVWTDGTYRNLSRDPEAGAIRYRVEIVTAQPLPEAVKEGIAASAEGHELSRVGQEMFVVGLFDDKALADRVAAAVVAADGSLEVKVAEIMAE